MHRLIPYITAVLLFCFTSCTKSPDNNPEGSGGTGVGAVRPKGTETETPKTAVIGPAGGKLTSKDGTLEIDIPAGALTQNTTIGVAAITSTTDASVGSNYRLTPHMTFEKPVKITFSYEDYKDSISSGCSIGIGFQDSAGIWQLKRRRTIDEIKKTVSVQTTHFSDWARLTPIKLTPAYSFIAPSEEIHFKLACWVLLPGNRDVCSIFKGDGPDINIPIEELYIIQPDHIDKWLSSAGDAEGAGKLTPDGGRAYYKASVHDAPVINPTYIAVLMKGNPIPFLAKVEVRPVNLGMFITVNNKQYIYSEAYVTGSSVNIGLEWHKETAGGTFYGAITWKGAGTGARHWSDDNQFNWEPEDASPPFVMQSYYNDGLQISGGAVNITKYGKVGEIVEGTFNVSSAGMTKVNGEGEYLGYKPVTGRFRVIRKN